MAVGIVSHCSVFGFCFAHFIVLLFGRSVGLRLFGPLRTVVMPGVRDWEQLGHCTQRILGPSQAWPDILRNAAMNSGVFASAFPEPNLRNSDAYLDLFSRPLDAAAPPSSGRCPRATAAGSRRERNEGGWIREQIRGLPNPARRRRELVEKTGIVSPELRIAVSQYTSVRKWRRICARRGVLFPNTESRRKDGGRNPLTQGAALTWMQRPGIQIAREGAGRGSWRRQRLWIWVRLARKVAISCMGPPAVEKENSAAHSSSPSSGSGWDATRIGQRADFSAAPAAPKKPGSPPEAPSFRRRKVAGQGGEQACSEYHRAEVPVMGFMVTITDNDFGHAGNSAVIGWPECSIPPPTRGPGDFSTDPVSRPGNLRNPPGDHGWRRRGNMDPLTQALREWGASW